MSNNEMDYDELCAWLRANSSGVYRLSALGADAIDQLRARVADLEVLKDSAGQSLRSFADQLTALEAERDDLKRTYRHLVKANADLDAQSMRDARRVAELDAENARLKSALERIADPRNTHYAGGAQVAARMSLCGRNG